MSVPHSDRDGSEAPKTLEGNEPETPFTASGSPSNPTPVRVVLRRVTDERFWDASDRALREATARAEATGHTETGEALRGAENGEERPTLHEHGREVREVARQVYGAEIEALRAEVEDWKAEVQRVDSERSAALVATSKDLTRVIDRARAAEAEVRRLAGIIDRERVEIARLMGTVERVRTLADEWERGYNSLIASGWAKAHADAIRAILDADAPEASEEGR